MKFDVVEVWLENVAYSHSRSESTENLYRQFIKEFCDFIGCTPQQILEEYETMTEKEFRRKYALILRSFISKQDGYTSNTVRTKVSVIKSFFKYNDLPLGYIPLARARVTFHNRDIDKDEVQKILEVSRPRDKAFFCMMAQTGLRPLTLCNLRLKHIQPDFDKDIMPCKIEVPQEIAKGEYHSYWTFMGEESVKYLKSYLATRPGIKREDYLFTSHGAEKRANPKSLSRIFANTIETLKEKGIMDFEQDEKGKPRTVRLYNLRKFFRKYANQAGFEFVQFWMGHVVKVGVDEHYRPKDVEFHRQLYKEKAMPFLRFETATPSETEKFIEEKMKEKDKEIEELRQKLKLVEEIEEKLNLVGKIGEIFDLYEEGEKLDETWWGEFEKFLKTKHPKKFQELQTIYHMSDNFYKRASRQVRKKIEKSKSIDRELERKKKEVKN